MIKARSVNDSGNDKTGEKKKTTKEFEIDYIAEEPDLDPSSLQFKRVFEAFRAAEMVMPEVTKKSGIFRKLLLFLSTKSQDIKQLTRKATT